MSNHFYRNIQIENFRGIDSLSVRDLEQVNLFVGRNNCGKTTVLESMFLLAGMSNPGLIQRIEEWRGILPTDGSDLRNLFFNRNHSKQIEISGENRWVRNLRVKPLFEDGDIAINVPDSGHKTEYHTKTKSGISVGSSTTDLSIVGLEFSFKYARLKTELRKGKQYVSTLRLAQQGEVPPLVYQSDARYKENTLARFISRQVMYDPQLVDEMLNSKQKDVIVEFLRKFEPKTVDVRITLDRIIAVDIGLDSFLPVNHLGGGPGRMLTILSGLYGTRTGILIIDEVENGFHVSSITELWRMILEHSRITNTQVFVTTHSRDVLEGLNDVLVGEQDSVACYWLSKLDSDQIKAYRYSPLELAGALDANIDIRH